MALPIYTKGEDVEGIIDYLKTKPTGASLEEAKPVVKKQLIDGRKLSAYDAWGFVQRDGDRLKLTDRGWAVARGKIKPEDAFREALDSIVPYRSALEWIYHQDLQSVTNVDVAAHWHQHYPDEIGTDNENTIKDQAVCFFRLAEAAGYGHCVIGRRGGATRLDVARTELDVHIQSGPSAPPWHHSDIEIDSDVDELDKVVASDTKSATEREPSCTSTTVSSLR